MSISDAIRIDKWIRQKNTAIKMIIALYNHSDPLCSLACFDATL